MSAAMPAPGAPSRWALYLDLIRWNRPAGWLLLLWPSLSALWIAAQRVALDRAKTDELTLKDFEVAAKTYLAPLRPAVQALHSKDPDRLAKYEDLLPGESNFWSSFWSRMESQ